MVQYMGITPNNPIGTTADASLSLTIKLLFTVVNPNKVGIKYGESRFTVMYRGIPLEKASVPGFYQEAHSVNLRALGDVGAKNRVMNFDFSGVQGLLEVVDGNTLGFSGVNLVEHEWFVNVVAIYCSSS
ncbi:Late embryogenesis abundant protein [Sesbania bispinosa]|nr:Late embryogenesis abundant protein [Sesbania bispinosa]